MRGFQTDNKMKIEEGKRRKSADVKAETPEVKKQRIEQFITALTKHEDKKKRKKGNTKIDRLTSKLLFEAVSTLICAQL